MHPVVSIFMIVLCVLTLTLPRRYAVLPLLVCMLYVPENPTLLLFGIHFTVVRVLLLCSLARVLYKHEFYFHDDHKIGAATITWAVAGIAAYLLLHGFDSTTIFRIGNIVDSIILYLFFKSIFKNFDDVIFVSKALPFLIIPLAILMVREALTGFNIFSMFSHIPALSDIRNGRIRCQGPFLHPILAGTFGATAMPFIVTLWWRPGYNKIICIIGFIAASTITFTAASSGAFLTFFLELVAFGFWLLRDQMRWVRRGIVAIIALLAISMKAPVWYIFAKLSDKAGGSGWHRSYLLDQAFGRYFHEWWMLGTKVTRHWMPYAGVTYSSNQTDITNQFLLEGVNGGITTMGLYILIIVFCFKAIGRTLHGTYGLAFPDAIFLWALGVALFGNIVSFMSISYFDQIIIFWYLLIGMIAAISSFPDFALNKNQSEVVQ